MDSLPNDVMVHVLSLLDRASAKSLHAASPRHAKAHDLGSLFLLKSLDLSQRVHLECRWASATRCLVTRVSCGEAAFRGSAARFTELRDVELIFDKTQTSSDVVAAMQQLAQQVMTACHSCRCGSCAVHSMQCAPQPNAYHEIICNMLQAPRLQQLSLKFVQLADIKIQADHTFNKPDTGGIPAELGSMLASFTYSGFVSLDGIGALTSLRWLSLQPAAPYNWREVGEPALTIDCQVRDSFMMFPLAASHQTHATT